MAYRGVFHSLSWFCVHLILFTAIVASTKACKKDDCPVVPPRSHYKALNCTPVYYEPPRDCCTKYYNCTHLNVRQNRHKCLINGYQYRIGEKLRQEDENICKKHCICEAIGNGLADFVCTNLKDRCPPYIPTEHCALRKPLEQCCSHEEVCVTPNEEKPTCKINGQTYADDKYFVPEEHPDLLCICRAYSKGRFKLSCTRSHFWRDINAVANFYQKCAPIYYLDLDESIGVIRQDWRCQEPNDIVYGYRAKSSSSLIKVDNGVLPAMYCPEPEYDDNGCPKPAPPCQVINAEGPLTITYDLGYMQRCLLGQMIMNVSEQMITISKDNNKTCITCVCEVPPVPTCLRRVFGDDCNQLIE